MIRKKFAVIGLGYFGLNLALRLSEQGAEVLAIDIDITKVELIADRVAHAVTLDSTDKNALINQGVNEMDVVIVAIGEGFESSITTTAILQEIGVKEILNRVMSPIHERLVKLMNINHLLVPEAEAAAHLAKRLMYSQLIETYEISKAHSIYEIDVPDDLIGKKLIDINLRDQYNLNLVTVKRITKNSGLITKGEMAEEISIGVPKPDYVFQKNDILVLFGEEKYFRNFIEK